MLKHPIEVLKQTELLGHQFTVYGTAEITFFLAKEVGRVYRVYDQSSENEIKRYFKSVLESQILLKTFAVLKSIRTFAVLQLTIKYANGIFYAHKGTYILKYRQTISVYHRPMAMVGCSKLGYLSAFLFNNK